MYRFINVVFNTRGDEVGALIGFAGLGEGGWLNRGVSSVGGSGVLEVIRHGQHSHRQTEWT